MPVLHEQLRPFGFVVTNNCVEQEQWSVNTFLYQRTKSKLVEVVKAIRSTTNQRSITQDKNR